MKCAFWFISILGINMWIVCDCITKWQT
jgi:type IV secretory pathway TrbD component